jgi:SM-20-related protein
MSDRTLTMQRHTQILREPERARLYDFLCDGGWDTGWKSNRKRDAFSFLHKHFAGFRNAHNEAPYECSDELAKNAPIVFETWGFLKERLLKNHVLMRCYANGMSYGMDGTVHIDSSRPNNYTFIYYPHERWSPNWGGETLFYNREETNVIACCYPHPNGAAFFDARIPHRANGVTRQYPGTRITLMFKTAEVIDAGSAQ